MAQKAFVYIVKCKDGSLYTGIAKDLKKRMREHYDKTGKVEYAIKRLVRKDKLKLIAFPEEEIKKTMPGLEGEVYVPKREYIMNVDSFLTQERGLDL